MHNQHLSEPSPASSPYSLASASSHNQFFNYNANNYTNMSSLNRTTAHTNTTINLNGNNTNAAQGVRINYRKVRPEPIR